MNWTIHQDVYIACWHGHKPLAELTVAINQEFDISVDETAVAERVRTLGLKSKLRQATWIYTQTDIKNLFGLGCHKSTRRLMQKMPTFPIYEGNRPALVIKKTDLHDWLAEPLNWYCVDLEKITDPLLSGIIERTRSGWNDKWLTTAEAADRLGYSYESFYKLIQNGTLPARRYGNYAILQSDVDKLRRLMEYAA